MTRIAIELPDSTLSALRKDPEELARDLRLAAAAKWYELGLVSQERGAEIAGLPRVEFMRALGRLGVSPFQEAMDKDLEDAH
jgi:predicted HTH domain antitoxin